MAVESVGTGGRGPSGDTPRYFAHSAPDRGGEWEPLAEHAELVAERAASYACAFGADAEARVAGLLHDAGKSTDLFARRLRNKVSGLDHWTPGAALALRKYRQYGIATALAVQGHHVGLRSAATDSLKKLGNLAAPWDRTLTSEEPEELARRLEAEGVELPELEESLYEMLGPHASSLLDVRMLFSCLVDADFLETEAHFDRDEHGRRRYRPEAPELRPERALDLVEQHVQRLAEENRETSSEAVQTLRWDLFQACWKKAEDEPGTFTLSAPTGSGKTLSMLAFALRHAVEHGLRRVVMAVPYLSILEQTAETYRDLLEPAFGEGYVLEHHSLAGTRGEEPKDDEQDRKEALRRRQAENWDAPLVVTTSVQLLESLFAHRPGPCRKLHRLAGSVLLFDEVQTLPPALAVGTLATLSRLAERYGASVVFSTATQPAFEHLDGAVREWTTGAWTPREVVADELSLFSRVDRVEVDWRIGHWTDDGWTKAEPLDWDDLARELEEAEEGRALCILNLKRHARQLAEQLEDRALEGVFHLSTAMCPAHRQEVLAEVKRRLKAGEPCHLVSTQCVEAGVDVDFPLVYRAFAPLDAIAQAAGRCNRNGRMAGKGRLVVFVPAVEGVLYPGGDYRLAAKVTEEVLQSVAKEGQEWNLQEPALFDRWYRRLYDLSGLGGEVKVQEEQLHGAMKARNFEETANAYRLIPDDSVQVVVPWDRRRFEELEEASKASPWVKAEWMRKAQVHSVSLYRSQLKEYRNALIPAPLGAERAEQRSEDWFLLREAGRYDDDFGLEEPNALQMV